MHALLGRCLVAFQQGIWHAWLQFSGNPAEVSRKKRAKPGL
jgi:hypothetical protein